jgi:hypothetical protein
VCPQSVSTRLKSVTPILARYCAYLWAFAGAVLSAWNIISHPTPFCYLTPLIYFLCNIFAVLGI